MLQSMREIVIFGFPEGHDRGRHAVPTLLHRKIRIKRASALVPYEAPRLVVAGARRESREEQT